MKRKADSSKVLLRCVQIYKYSPTLKPLTSGVNNTDYPVTVQHSAGKLSFIAFMWIILLTFATHLNTVALWQRQRLIPPPARQPQCNLFRNNSRNSAKSLKHWFGFQTHRFQSDHVITVIHGGPTQPTYRLKLSFANTPVPDTTGHPWRPSVYSLMGQRFFDCMRETQRIKQMVLMWLINLCQPVNKDCYVLRCN